MKRGRKAKQVVKDQQKHEQINAHNFDFLRSASPRVSVSPLQRNSPLANASFESEQEAKFSSNEQSESKENLRNADAITNFHFYNCNFIFHGLSDPRIQQSPLNMQDYVK
jgi:hypothetical protein